MSKRSRETEVDNGGDNTDDYDKMIAALKAQLAETEAKKAKTESELREKTNGLIFDLSLPPTKQDELEKIQKPENRRLQQLLWERGCKYTLLPHQFDGVRAMAGVSDDFPGEEMFSAENKRSTNKQMARFEALRNAKPRRQGDDSGLILADVMGLGKTVQTVAAIRIHSDIATARGEPKRPTCIISPNGAVLDQWKEHLLRSGVKEDSIVRFKTKNPLPLSDDNLIFLLTKHNLQTEQKHVQESLDDPNDPGPPFSPPHNTSALFPTTSEHLLRVLKNQYDHANRKGVKNKYNQGRSGERLTHSTVVTRHLKKEARSMSQDSKSIFRMVVIDEAHHLKNLVTFFGLGAGLVCLHSSRVVLLTGTPFNNSCQDMATLMTYINPFNPAAEKHWWDKATEPRAADQIKTRLADWTSKNLLRRRKDVIAKDLPSKNTSKKEIPGTDLSIYEKYEKNLITALGKVHELKGREDKLWEFQNALKCMLGIATLMQLALVHNVLPDGGRQISVLFSPSRCYDKSLKKGLEKKTRCECCKRFVKLASGASKKVKVAEEAAEDIDDLADSGDNDHDNEWLVNPDSNGRSVFVFENIENQGRSSNNPIGTGDIVEIPGHLCQLSAHGIHHFACKSCIAKMECDSATCPKCSDLLARLACSRDKSTVPPETESNHGYSPDSFGGFVALAKRKCTGLIFGSGGACDANTNHASADTSIPLKANDPGRVYCPEIFGGFVASAKLQRILTDLLVLLGDEKSKDDKVLLFAFSKGCLDMLERMLHDNEVRVARYDGDFNEKKRNVELQRFKKDPSCQVILMTPHTGGTGLNIPEANHVWFAQRYWNPVILEQCEDRAYRIGQKKDVNVVYYDVPLTIDDIMWYLNVAKKDNASIVLSDSVTLGNFKLSFKELSGFLGNAFRAIREARDSCRKDNAKEVLDRVVQDSGPIFSEEHGPRIDEDNSTAEVSAVLTHPQLNLRVVHQPPPLQIPSVLSLARDWDSGPILLNECGSSISTRSQLENQVYAWSNDPSSNKKKPLIDLIQTIPMVLPPMLKVIPCHCYFDKWQPLTASDCLRQDKCLKKVQKFLHPDKLPKNFNADQTLLCKLLWDVFNTHSDFISQESQVIPCPTSTSMKSLAL